MKRDEVIGGIIVFGLGGMTVLGSLQMPIGTFRMAGSGLFPLWLGIFLMLLALLHLLNLWFSRGALQGEQGTAARSSGETRQMLLFLGASAAATLCLDILGYPLTAFGLMLLLLRILGVRRPSVLVTLPLLTAVGSYLLFVQFLKIPLPKGLIGL
jgi:hypothetical protein